MAQRRRRGAASRASQALATFQSRPSNLILGQRAARRTTGGGDGRPSGRCADAELLAGPRAGRHERGSHGSVLAAAGALAAGGGLEALGEHSARAECVARAPLPQWPRPNAGHNLPAGGPRHYARVAFCCRSGEKTQSIIIENSAIKERRQENLLRLGWCALEKGANSFIFSLSLSLPFNNVKNSIPSRAHLAKPERNAPQWKS